MDGIFNSFIVICHTARKIKLEMNYILQNFASNSSSVELIDKVNHLLISDSQL